MSAVDCPNCGVRLTRGEQTGGRCGCCGQAVPVLAGLAGVTARSAAPRADGPSRKPVVRPAESEEARKKAKRTSEALIAVAVFQFIGATLLLLIPRAWLSDRGMDVSRWAVIVPYSVVAVYTGLAIWARTQPLVPSLLGLGLYVLISVLDFVTVPRLMSSGAGLGLRAAVVIVLIMGVSAAFGHRRLSREGPGA